VTLQVLQDDGSLLAACINAACVALMDAGIQCAHMCSAINIGISSTDLKLANERVKKAQNTTSSMVLDPTFDEEQASAATLTIAYGSNAGANGGIISSFSSGLAMNDMVYLQAMDIARRGCAYIIQFYRTALTKKIQNQYE
jgi:exosome complex component RRP46